jgi:hypothetical protein
MDRAFRDDDREKPVVTSDGRTVGRVSDIQEDRATVERTEDDDSLTDEIKDMLGWDDDEETREVRRDQIDRYDDEQFHLQPRR